jgi:hypothetical protein
VTSSYEWFREEHGGLVPKSHHIFGMIKSQHIVHRRNIRLNITNHNLDIITLAIIHLSNSTRPLIPSIVDGREIVESDIGRCGTSERESHLFLHGNRGLGEGEANMPGNTYENDAVFFGEADGRKCLSRTRGGSIKNQFRSLRRVFAPS